MIQPVDVSQLLPTLVLVQLVHKYNDRDGGYTQVQTAEVPTEQGWSSHAAAECPNCQQQKTTLIPQYGTILQGDHIVIQWQVEYIRSLPYRKENNLDRNWHSFWIWICLSFSHGLNLHHYSRAYRMFDPPTWNPVHHCIGSRKALYSTAVAAVDMWPCDSVISS